MTNAGRLILLAVVVNAAACSESALEPTAPSQASPVLQGEGSRQALTRVDTLRFSITIDPTKLTVYNLGEGNTLTFPAGSVCDPYTSSYGENEWDKPCSKATKTLTVNVKGWLDTKGHARIDFDKHMRFVPSSNPAQWVIITFDDFEASLDPMFNILYCPSSSSKCKDESKKDPTLLPMKNPITRKIQRRIKHFSGYNVAAGKDADDALDGWFGALTIDRGPFLASATSPVPPAKRNRGPVEREKLLSGYILASGTEV
jgi:hypothetical protein